MKIIILLLCSSFCFAQNKDSTKVVSIGFNDIEIKKTKKQWHIIDSINAEISKRWVYKLNALGIREEDIIKEIPTGHRDSLKLVIKK